MHARRLAARARRGVPEGRVRHVGSVAGRAHTYGFATLSRGCEFALDDSRKEEFESSQHLTPEDVTLAISGGYTNLSVLMRKRKDLRVLRGKQSRVVLAGGGTVLDPVGDMIEWLRRRRALGLPEDAGWPAVLLDRW